MFDKIARSMGMIEGLRDRMSRPIFYEGLRDRIVPKVERGELSLDAPFLSIADSLDIVELDLEIREMGFDISVAIETVGDFLWLIKKIEYRKFRTGSSA